MSDTTAKNCFATRGGAKVGWVNYSWPLARLEVNSEELTVTTTMFGLFKTGSYTFSRAQIVSIERYSVFPLLGNGLRIVHSVIGYPQKLIFWCRPDTVLRGIASTGFTLNDSGAISPAVPDRGFPVRWPPLIALIVIWNLLLGYESVFRRGHFTFPGPFTLLALTLVFTLSMATLFSSGLQSKVLRPGRQNFLRLFPGDAGPPLRVPAAPCSRPIQPCSRPIQTCSRGVEPCS